MNIEQYLTQVCGRTPIRRNNQVDVWASWYKGKVKNFHTYRLYNGQQSMDMHKKSLMMAKTVSEDWANLLANESTQVVIGEADQQKLDAILKNNNFSVLLNDAVEKSFALGNGYLVLGLDNVEIGKESGLIKPSKDTEITIDFIDALNTIPLTIKRKRVIECAFISEHTDGKTLAVHLKDENTGNYIIRVAEFNEDDEFLSDYVINTQNKLSWFVHIKPNINNNSFLYSDLGCSIYASAIDVLKTIDDIFDAFDNDYILARMKVFVSEKAWKWQMDNKGNMQKTFDPFDTLFYTIPDESTSDDKPLLEVSAPQIRYDAFIQGLNSALNELSKKCGFGTEYYKYDKGSMMTATQVMSENSDLARSLRKQENLMRSELTKLILAIIRINNDFTLNDKFKEIGINDISIIFDDSIIEDKDSIMKRDREDVMAGLMTEAEYRTKHYGLNKEDAEQDYKDKFLYRELNKYLQPLQANAITPEEFVNRVYGENYSQKQELIEMITEAIDKANYNPLEAWDEEHSNEDEEDKEDKVEE